MQTVLNNLCLLIGFFSLFSTVIVEAKPITHEEKHVIIVVCDGLRPDAVTPQHTPHLYALMKNGVHFMDHHASFPTVTVVNAVSLLTGNYADKTGFFGNTIWQPNASGFDKNHHPIDFEQPVFTDDTYILHAFSQVGLTLTDTLFQAASKQNRKTAFVGNVGAQFLANATWSPLRKNAPVADPIHYLSDGVTPNPIDTHGSAYKKIDNDFATTYLKHILPLKPSLSILWLADPDGTEHDFGFGTPNYFIALNHIDTIIGDLLLRLHKLNMDANTDILIISDHAQSFISGSLTEFPLRNIQGKRDEKGFSVSGDIRTADLMTKAGFHAFDGEGCRYDPVLSAITSSGKPLYPTVIDKTGDICGKAGQKYNTPAYKVPKHLPDDAIIVATNSSSNYFYIPSHNKAVMLRLVRFLQSNEPFGALFINTHYYPPLPGTLSLETVHLAHRQGPDLIVSLNYDANTAINGIKGIEFCDYPNERGTHGSFSLIDVHNFFIAIGPDFRRHLEDTLPTATVDIAPTVATILGIHLSPRAGRVLVEALVPHSTESIQLKKTMLTSSIASRLTMFNAMHQSMNMSHYQIHLYTKQLFQAGQRYTYFDEAQAIRQ